MYVRLVGSILKELNPSDIDLIEVLPDNLFYSDYGMSALQFSRMLATGEWDSRMFAWSAACVEKAHKFQKAMGTEKEVDFKILPETYSKMYEDDLSHKTPI